MRVRDRQTGRNTTMPTCGVTVVTTQTKKCQQLAWIWPGLWLENFRPGSEFKRREKKKLTDRLDSGIECQAVQGDTQTQSGTQRLFLSSKKVRALALLL